MTVEEAVRRVAKRLGVTGRAIICPYAEVGMDVDKPHQLELMRKDLAKRVKRESKKKTSGKAAKKETHKKKATRK